MRSQPIVLRLFCLVVDSVVVVGVIDVAFVVVFGVNLYVHLRLLC